MKKGFLYLSSGLLVLLIIIAASFQYSRSWEHAFFIDPFYEIDTGDSVIALTFDDGPSPVRTTALLALLNEQQTRATFFMLGQNIEKYPEVARAVFEQGHLIGNHSYDHPRLIFKSPRYVREQISRTDSLIKAAGQEEVEYFRAPGSSKFLVLPLVIKRMGKQFVTGSYDPPSEYRSPYNADIVASEVIENVGPGSIIYLHDGKDTGPDEFVRSVELIITALRARGYSFVSLDYKTD